MYIVHYRMVYIFKKLKGNDNMFSIKRILKMTNLKKLTITQISEEIRYPRPNIVGLLV